MTGFKSILLRMIVYGLNLGIQLTVFSILLLDASPSVAAFKKLKITAMTPCHFTLTQIVDVSYECWQFKDADAKLAVWEHSIGFFFGQLTYEQWLQIKQAYGARHSTFPYEAHKEYWLIDFMPPLMQAVNRHRFESEMRTSPQALLSEVTPTIMANCWGTLYELLRLREKSLAVPSYLMMVDAHKMLKTLESISISVNEPQPGDFLLITHRNDDRIYLDHAALYVDQELLFEKAGAGDAVPYRLVDSQTIQKIWRPDVFEYHIRRPIANRTLPHPQEFSEQYQQRRSSQDQWTVIYDETPPRSDAQYFSIFPLPPFSRSKGQFTLPQFVYRSEYYQGEPSILSPQK